MAELPLDQAIPRFKTNEDRVDRFTNGNQTATWTTNTGQVLPSLSKFLADKDDEINTAAGGILSESQAAKDTAVAAKNDAVTAKDAAQTASSASQNWAESASAPGAPGTKSAKTWAGEAAASAALFTRADDTDMQGIPNPATEKWVKPAQVRTAFEKMQFKPGDMANARTMADIMAFTGLTPFNVGAEATNSDHAPKLNTLYDRIITGGGGIAWLPPMPGDYKAGSSMPLHKTGVTGSYLSVRGTGDKARIKWLPSTGDAFVIGNGSTPVYYVSIENIYLYAAVARTSGIDFKLRKANIINLKNIVTDGSYAGFHGEDLNSVYGTLLHFNMPNQTSGAGVTVYSNPAGSGRTDIVKFDEVTVQAYNAGSYGLVVDGRVAGVHTDGFYALGVNRGLQIVSAGTGLANIPNFCDFRKFEVDRATNIAVVIEKGYRTEFSRCDISNTSGAMDVPYPQGSNDDCAMFLGLVLSIRR